VRAPRDAKRRRGHPGQDDDLNGNGPWPDCLRCVVTGTCLPDDKFVILAPAPAAAGTLRSVNILIVEDEPKTGEYLRQGLREAGFGVDLATRGNDGLHMALEGRHDLVILDVMLPELDGWQVLKGLRSMGREMPVLFLTARDQIEDRVKGLELGADDYLVKPFSFAELLARVRVILRRGRPGQEQTFLELADLTLDLLRRRVTRSGKRIDLTAKEFGLLELLMRRQGEVLPRSLIASQVWDLNFDSDTNVIDVAVRRLRAKVDEGFEPRLIHTVRGMGYVMETPEPDA
jgi:two-component system, OmpR family, copper resistance phosphate regulon response regulator CusR